MYTDVQPSIIYMKTLEGVNNRHLSGHGTSTWWLTDYQDFISDEHLMIWETACNYHMESIPNVAILK